MKKFLLSIAVLGLAMQAGAEEAYYNFFDPEDCDAEGWLWLDTQEKIEKYVGVGKKIQLVEAQYEVEDPEYPGEYYTPQCSVSPDFKGYNQLGEEGGEGSVTGGILLPAASYDPEEDWYATDGGGFLIAMPDCKLFEVYASQSLPELKFEFYVAREETDDYTACEYLWDDDPDWWTGEGGPVITEYCGPYLNIQDIELDYDMGEGNPDIYSIYGPKGEARTAYIANYTNDEVPNSTCPIYIHGLRIFTFTQASNDTYVGAIAAENVKLNVNGKVVSLSAPAEINVYDLCGDKVASAYGTSLDCSALNGVYVVKAAGQVVKVVL